MCEEGGAPFVGIMLIFTIYLHALNCINVLKIMPENKHFNFFSECPHSQYGKACSFQCGNCLNPMPCNYINGSCHGGCSSGWTGDKCNQSEYKIYYEL